MKISSFDGLSLPAYEIADDIPLALSAPAEKIPGMAGAFEPWGDDQVRDPLVITRQFELVGSTYADVDTQLDAIRAKTNKRGWLEIEMRDGTKRGTWARLTRVSAPYQPEFYGYLPVDLTFVANWPWLQLVTDGWFLDTGYTLDSGLLLDGNYTTQAGSGTFSINNTGGGPITRGIIEIRGSAANPTITNSTNGWSIAYAGTVASGSRLVIDMGAQAVTLNGADAWSAVTLGAYNTGLMRLEKGNNVITFSGGGTLIWHWAKVY